MNLLSLFLHLSLFLAASATSLAVNTTTGWEKIYMYEAPDRLLVQYGGAGRHFLWVEHGTAYWKIDDGFDGVWANSRDDPFLADKGRIVNRWFYTCQKDDEVKTIFWVMSESQIEKDCFAVDVYELEL